MEPALLTDVVSVETPTVTYAVQLQAPDVVDEPQQVSVQLQVEVDGQAIATPALAVELAPSP